MNRALTEVISAYAHLMYVYNDSYAGTVAVQAAEQAFDAAEIAAIAAGVSQDHIDAACNDIEDNMNDTEATY